MVSATPVWSIALHVPSDVVDAHAEHIHVDSKKATSLRRLQNVDEYSSRQDGRIVLEHVVLHETPDQSISCTYMVGKSHAEALHIPLKVEQDRSC